MCADRMCYSVSLLKLSSSISFNLEFQITVFISIREFEFKVINKKKTLIRQIFNLTKLSFALTVSFINKTALDRIIPLCGVILNATFLKHKQH